MYTNGQYNARFRESQAIAGAQLGHVPSNVEGPDFLVQIAIHPTNVGS
jgi:hypothetical protein